MITINEVFAWNRGPRSLGDKMISIKEIKDFDFDFDFDWGAKI